MWFAAKGAKGGLNPVFFIFDPKTQKPNSAVRPSVKSRRRSPKPGNQLSAGWTLQPDRTSRPVVSGLPRSLAWDVCWLLSLRGRGALHFDLGKKLRSWVLRRELPNVDARCD